MMQTILKQHWMSEVLKTSEPALAGLAQTTPAAQVWSTAQSKSGLSIDQLTKTVAAHFKLAVADLDAADLRILKLVPEKLARRYMVLPIRQDDRHLYIATSEPGNLQAAQDIAFASSRSTVFQVAAPEAIQQAIERGYCPATDSYGFPSQAIDRLFLQMTEPAKLPAAPTIAFALDCIPVLQPPVLQPPVPQAIPESIDVSKDGEERSVAPVAMDEPHVLIVDDDCVTRRLAWSILAKQGYRVVEASDGIEALERVFAGTPLTLIVLDLDMPRLGGRDVLMRLKSSASTSRIPIIVLTGSGEDTDEAELMEEGADDYIRKPLESARFMARIKGVLRRAKG